MQPKGSNNNNSGASGGKDEGEGGVVVQQCEAAAWPRPLPLHLRWFGWASASLFCAIFYLAPLCVLAAPLLLYLHPPSGAVVAGAVLASLVWPSKPWPAMVQLCQLWYHVFDFHHNLSPNARKRLAAKYGPGKKKAIFGGHPHGIIPVQALLWQGYVAQYIPEIYGFGAGASVVNWIPFLRNVLAWLPAYSVEYDVLMHNLQDKNLFFFPGGVAEIFHAKPGNDIVLCRRRKGLVRLAFQSGSDLVPVYFFGMNELFEQLSTNDGWFGRLSRSMRTGVTFFWGQYGLPIPFQAKVCICVGEPIEIDKNENPTDEQIQEVLDEYMKRMQTLFDTHKVAAGYPNAVLQIV